jgi:dephospho-CoA kinase
MTVVAELIVVTGPPGAGKSTVAELLSQQFDRSALVAGDAFFGFLRRGSTAPWIPESHEQNTAVVAARSGHGVTDLDAAKDMWHQFAQASVDARHVLSGALLPPPSH